METEKHKLITSQEEYSKIFTENIRKESLKTALDTRKFEIDLYWKRATYFWAFIAATFAAFFVLLNSDKIDNYRFITIAVSVIGLFFSVGWYFVNRGSKHWQENWEEHVSYLERSIQGPLFGFVKTPVDKFYQLTKGYPLSVSKVNQILSLMMILFWLGGFVFSLNFTFSKMWESNNKYVFLLSKTAVGIAVSLVIVFILIWLFKFYSHSFLVKDKRKYTKEELNKASFMSRINANQFVNKTPLSNDNFVKMGNDEFILYIRKKEKKCSLTNDQLGKMIWLWLKDQNRKGQKFYEEPVRCMWGSTAKNIGELGLPKTATQFEFDRNLLPELYCHLDELAKM
ncbi:hypothetical protein [Carboxylicivirga sp. M1479]|uniref:RipA family octameric membrane protein n=1 Tax=Carboxylicivirga sp. M1479 TaxID=2594476 RepID=UPI0011786CB5|nr:hypothetical protein [Carboxylicivirga sp. M1479]TRX70719.1 hypothetical protein FNN09_10625 [Carboxylicivirga sp. M1479]